MVKMLTAIAVARKVTGTVSRITALTGDVETKMAVSATRNSGKNQLADGERMAAAANGAPTTAPSAQMRKKARARPSWSSLGSFLVARSLQIPPIAVPTAPAMTVTAPIPLLAIASSIA
jgi:hypothetical protein